jgi:hypothetical protein
MFLSSECRPEFTCLAYTWRKGFASEEKTVILQWKTWMRPVQTKGQSLFITSNNVCWYHVPQKDTMRRMLHTFVYASKFDNPWLIMWKYHINSNYRISFKLFYQHFSKYLHESKKKLWKEYTAAQRAHCLSHLLVWLLNLFCKCALWIYCGWNTVPIA